MAHKHTIYSYLVLIATNTASSHTYSLSSVVGTQVMLLVASETGHVYTFATKKLQPMITSDAGKALIQTCLNSPDEGDAREEGDQRMCAEGFEETEIVYTVENKVGIFVD